MMTRERLRIRSARADDLPALAALEAAAFPGPGSPAWSPALLAGELGQPRALMLVAIAEDGAGAVLGYASFRYVGPEAELLRVAVDPEARSRGVGRALAEAGLERLRALGVATCFLEVRPGNAPALALYARLGFRQIDRRRRYFADGSDALVLQTSLACHRSG